MTRQPSLASIKAGLRPGMQLDVTNHYITRPDHPWFGTTRRTVLRVTRTGVVQLFGGGASQRPDDLFLTLTPVPGTGGPVDVAFPPLPW